MSNEPATVWVRRHWNGWDGAQYPMDAVTKWHWRQTSGGEVNGFARRAPRPMPHGYVSCGVEPLAGEIAHSCKHGPPPHRILVVMVKKDNDADTIRAVIAQTAPQRGTL